MKNKGVLDKNYADERVKRPELVFRYKTRALIVKNKILKHYKKKNQLEVMSFGAAEGLTLVELDKLINGNSFTGVEFSQDLINKAPILPNNIKLIKGDVTKLNNKIKSQKFDVVIALALLEHLKNPKKAIVEAESILKKGGLFIATSPSPFWDSVSTKFGLLRDDQHEYDMTKKQFKKFIKNSGLSFVEFDRFMWSPVSFLPYLKVKLNPKLGLKIDAIVNKLKIFNMLYVNQIFIAKKN